MQITEKCPACFCYANPRKILAFPHWAGDHQVIETGLHGQGKNHILCLSRLVEIRPEGYLEGTIAM